jgi:hypothetical protein
MARQHPSSLGAAFAREDCPELPVRLGRKQLVIISACVFSTPHFPVIIFTNMSIEMNKNNL